MNSGNNIPSHVSIIMDGNGRWARQRGLQRWQGHVEGVSSVRSCLKEAAKCGVKYLSLYAFSEENWNRSAEEVGSLMDLMVKSMLGEIEKMEMEDVRFVVLGNRARLSDKLNLVIDDCMERTRNSRGIVFIIFLSYSGRWDILQAARRLALDSASDPSVAEKLTMEDFSRYLVTSDFPDPDLIIRTSGEQRLSNYLLWQSAYTEFYFTDTLWPDFREKEFRSALDAFSKRDRRFGGAK